MSDFSTLFPQNPNHPVIAALPQLHWETEPGTPHIGEGTEIGEHVVIEEGVSIGKNCLIRPHAYIRSGTIIEDHVVIGHGSEIKNSYLFSGAKVGSHCFVGDSIIGAGARIGSGTITGNRRFDQQPIDWMIKNETISSNRDKLGLLLGEFARLGANVTTNPGTTIGAYTWVSGGEVLSGSIPEKRFIKIGGEQVVNKQAKELKAIDQSGQR